MSTRRISSRFVSLISFVSLALLAGCASRPVNPPITMADPGTGYSCDVRQSRGSDPNKETIVVLAFSGGGTRAASFSYGVLEYLRNTKVTDSNGRTSRLLDSVDLITGVSGGSFTALAYALYGDKLFDDYETRFLKRNVQGDLTKRTLNPLKWPMIWSRGVGRSELASELYDEILFNGATFGDLVDAGERYRFVNRYYETLFGTPRSQLVSRPVREVIGEAAYAEALPRIRTALAGELVSFEAAIEYSKAGHRDVSVTYAPDVAPGGRVRGFIAVVNDITAQKTAERRERERMRELAHATRLASVGELATQIAHEVNQPITAMITYCAAAQRNALADSPNNTRLAGLIGAIADEAQRVSAVIRRLRDFVRKGEIAVTPPPPSTTDTVTITRARLKNQNLEIRATSSNGFPMTAEALNAAGTVVGSGNLGTSGRAIFTVIGTPIQVRVHSTSTNPAILGGTDIKPIPFP